MNLSVKARIAVAMLVVVAVNVIAGVAGWELHSRAVDADALAVRAANRASSLTTLSDDVTSFVNEATGLALAVNTGVSEESSAEYGDLIGANATVGRAIGALPSAAGGTTDATIGQHWESLRTAVFVWVNAEAERGESNVRLTLTDTGQVRASVRSNIERPAALAGMDAGALRREVRRESEAYKDDLLRVASANAMEEAQTARGAEARARALASNVTLVAIGISIIVALMAAVWLYGTIAGPLDEAKRVAEAVAGGDYARVFKRQSNDEIGALVHAVEDMRDAIVGKIAVMREMAGAVLVTAEGVEKSASAARQVAALGEGAIDVELTKVEAGAGTLGMLAGQMLEA